MPKKWRKLLEAGSDGELAPAMEAVIDAYGVNVTVICAHNGQHRSTENATELARIMSATYPDPLIFLGYVVTDPHAKRRETAYARISRGSVTDTKLQVGQFAIPSYAGPTRGEEEMSEADRYQRGWKEDLPKEYVRFFYTLRHPPSWFPDAYYGNEDSGGVRVTITTSLTRACTNVNVNRLIIMESLVNYQTSLQLSLELASILEAAMFNFHYYSRIGGVLSVYFGILHEFLVFGVSSISATPTCTDYTCMSDPDCPSGCKCNREMRRCVPTMAGENNVYKWLGVVIVWLTFRVCMAPERPERRISASALMGRAVLVTHVTMAISVPESVWGARTLPLTVLTEAERSLGRAESTGVIPRPNDYLSALTLYKAVMPLPTDGHLTDRHSYSNQFLRVQMESHRAPGILQQLRLAVQHGLTCKLYTLSSRVVT
ncbi:hypothetical protein BGY98DRAFT_937401 [Russula aff. rugulosa BPL654]|nr:hypothetical protein BGY98DRAFT_937401 [Russula aff. rugulosa BPL654]